MPNETPAPSDAPLIAQRKGFYHEVKAGERYWWCRCGRSRSQPFCDGSHVGTGFQPVLFKAEKDEEVIFCGCKHTGTPPFCDGTHSNLEGGYRSDDPESAANRQIVAVAADAGPLVRLDGQCFVFATSRARLHARQGIAYCPVIRPGLGAQFQSQFYAEVAGGSSPVISADGRHTVLFVNEGAGEVEINGRRFSVEARSGVYIRPGEAYRIHNAAGPVFKCFISNGPGSEDLSWRDVMPTDFDARYPNRIALIDPAQRHRMAERHYQMLVSREQGSTVITQFIGNIPLSKAEPHRHLYEEALIFLAGTGMVWTERTKTPVSAGDVLFLPRKQVHSVQCTCTEGLDVVGVIYPGDNPAINY